MAKKSSKSTRRARSKKEQAPKKKITTEKAQVAPEAVVIVEGSDEPVAEKTIKKIPARKPTKPKEVSAETVIDAAVEKVVTEATAEEVAGPPRGRMLVSAFALAVIVIALIFGAGIIRQQNEQRAAESAQAGQGSAAADDILQSGGKMCTNQQATSDTTGSSNPQSVGMVLQSNPTSTLQTPQTLGGGSSDAAALQGAACF